MRCGSAGARIRTTCAGGTSTRDTATPTPTAWCRTRTDWANFGACGVTTTGLKSFERTKRTRCSSIDVQWCSCALQYNQMGGGGIWGRSSHGMCDTVKPTKLPCLCGGLSDIGESQRRKKKGKKSGRKPRTAERAQPWPKPSCHLPLEIVAGMAQIRLSPASSNQSAAVREWCASGRRPDRTPPQQELRTIRIRRHKIEPALPEPASY